MSIFEYVPEFYKAQWSAQLFPYKVMILVSLVFLNSIMLEAVTRARKNLSQSAYIFLFSGGVFLLVTGPLGIDNVLGIMVITAAFTKFLQDEHRRRIETHRFEVFYMSQIAQFITMQRYTRGWY